MSVFDILKEDSFMSFDLFESSLNERKCKGYNILEPTMIHNVPQTSHNQVRLLNIGCGKAYIKDNVLIFRPDKYLDHDSTAAEALVTHWYKLRFVEGQFQLFSFLRYTTDAHILKIADDFWNPMGKVVLGQTSQQRCALIKEELMQKMWHPNVIAKRISQGREDLLFDV